MASKRAVRKENTNLKDVEKIYTCPTCGNRVPKKFCEFCGEKKLQEHDFSLRHFAEETLEGFTHFDNKFFKTAYLLILKPGQLSVYFCQGRRVPYLKPFPMFIVCNILFFLLIGQTNIFAQPLYSFYNYEPYINFNTKEIIHSFVKSNAEFRILEVEFNQRMGAESKAFLAIFIPVLALGSMTVNYRRRPYFSEHLTFSAHFFTFMLILYTVWSLVIINPYYEWVVPDEEFDSSFDAISSFICIATLAAYFGIASRKFYKVSLGRSVVGGIVIALTFMISLMSYRMFLFYKIIYSLH